MVLVDTSVWSLALRRRRPIADSRVEALTRLIRDGQAVMAGPIRQELLSGIREQSQFARLRRALRAFPDLALVTGDYERAAVFSNQCRAHGVQASTTDFLLCAIAANRRLALLTADEDFASYAQWVPIRLYDPGVAT